MIRSLLELATSALRLLQAKIRGLSKPCPPHDHEDGKFLFCVKCGKYPGDPDY